MSHITDKPLYDYSTFKCSKIITSLYSTSFSLGISLLNRELRDAIYAIYGFVRYADEIVDTFHEFDKEMLLKEFKADTYKAIERKISLNPVLHSFQIVVNEYKVDHELIDAFLDSMEMDLHGKSHDENSYNKYIYGSAEVVGLMCLKVFCEGNQSLYDELKEPARSLGAAFQKVNFLRDLKDDFDDRGRVYFPGVDFSKFTPKDKSLIEADIQKDFDHALEGIKKLPSSSKKGVYLAYRYYTKLFKKIKQKQPETIREERIRINNASKMYIMAKSYARYELNMF
jgi:phytoene/squalene synthetase